MESDKISCPAELITRIFPNYELYINMASYWKDLNTEKLCDFADDTCNNKNEVDSFTLMCKKVYEKSGMLV